MRSSFIEGDRVFLAPLAPSDAENCFGWFLDVNTRRFLSSHAMPNTIDKTRKFIEAINASHEDVLLGIFLKDESGRHVGNIALHGIDHLNRHAHIGIAIGVRECLGRGLGTEATRLILDYGFNTLNLHMIFLNVFADNERAIKSYERVGFKKCGAIPECFYREGGYIDCVLMYILKNDFESLKNKK